MKRLQRAALLTELADRLRDAGSWCGETHLQKATYLLQELVNVPTAFEFILYKFGPYSFELGDELTALCADGLMELRVRHPSYGATLLTTEASTELRRRFPVTLGTYSHRLEFIAKKLGDKGVADLECIATALYVTREGKAGSSVKNRAARLTKLKPHVALASAIEAVKELDQIAEEVETNFAEAAE